MQPLLSLFTYTHYSKAKHYASLMNLIAIAEQFPELEVIISDNSKNNSKYEFLKKFECTNVKIFEGPYEHNDSFSLNLTSGQYVMASGDDDLPLSAGIGAILNKIKADNTNEKASPAGYAGIYCLKYRDHHDFFKLDSCEGDILFDRVQGWMNFIPKGNPFQYIVLKRQVAIDSYKLYKAIPNLQAYQDMLLTLNHVLSGRISFVDTPFFIFDMTNWGGRQSMIDSEIRYLTYHQAGYVPVSFVLIQRLELAITGFFLIQSNKFNGNQDDKTKAAIAWLNRWMYFWRQSLEYGYEAIELVSQCPNFSNIMKIVDKYRQPTNISPEEVLQEIATILKLFNNSGQTYINFWKNI